MLIQWITKNELGEEEVGTHPYVNTNNASTYAKRNCRQCNGKGYGSYDNGWEYYVESSENDQPQVTRRRLNERAVLCDCAIRTLSKTGI